MPFSMKFWQVQGKDLRELTCEALTDEQQLQGWLGKKAGHAAETEWIVDSAKSVVTAGGKTNSREKSEPPPSNATAFQETKARAAKGDAAAQAALGFRYELGIDGSVNTFEAIKWYRKAAQQGNARAQCNLDHIAAQGFVYGPEVPAPADAAEALEWRRKAAEKGDTRAQFDLGQMYEWGDGAPRDPAKALKWYRAAADQGEAAAQYKLGLCYCDGRGVPQNTAEAVRWWRKAAEQGEAAAQYKLGLCYCNAQGVAQDYAEAVKWYRKAAEQGDVMAQSRLGDAYYIGVGIPANHAEAVKWYSEAAEQGEASAQRHLGIIYGLGQGVPKNYAVAYKWYTLAAEQHDTNALHNRDTIASSMTPSQIAEGQRLSQEFLARRPKGDVNRGNGESAVVEVLPDERQIADSSVSVTTIGGSDILGTDVLVIGRQVATDTGGTIDLLGIDAGANLVVLQLKRDKAPQEIVAQTLEHAAWVKSLPYEQIDAIANSLTGKPLAQAFADHFGSAIPEAVNASHSMIIVTSEWDATSERIMQYLAKQHGVPIRVLFMALIKLGSEEFLASAGG
jgi:TPR repeat protein